TTTNWNCSWTICCQYRRQRVLRSSLIRHRAGCHAMRMRTKNPTQMTTNAPDTDAVDNTNPPVTLRLVQTSKPKVLIVEDHDDSRQMLRVLMEMKSCHVFEACNGLEAVEIASREEPDLILMDGSLPLLDGLEATRRIRE